MVGDLDGFARPLWLDLRKRNWTHLLRAYTRAQGGARLSLSRYWTSESKSAANVISCGAIMGDLDGSSSWRFASPALSIVVASGSSTDGHRHVHAVTLLAEGIEADDAPDLFRGEADRLGGDPNYGAGATGSVRVPLDEHDLLVFHPERRLQPLDLRRRHSCPRRRPMPTLNPSADRASSVVNSFSRAQAAVAAGASRNVTGYRLAFDLWSRGLSEDEAIEAGREFIEEVEDLKPTDENPYGLDEWEGQCKRRWKDGPAEVDPVHVARVDEWEVSWLADPSTGASQKTIVSAIAGRARVAGRGRVTISRRQLAYDARLSRSAVERAMKGSKTRAGLIGRALKRVRGKKGSAKGAYRFRLKTSLLASSKHLHTEVFSPFVGLDLHHPLKPSSTVPANHDGWAELGHGCRVLYDVLVGFDVFPSISALTRHPALSNHRTTIRRQLVKLEDAALVVMGSDGERAVCRLEDLDDLLDAVVEQSGTEGLGERLAEQHHRERIAWAESQDAFARRQERRRELMRRAKRRRNPHPNVGHLESEDPIAVNSTHHSRKVKVMTTQVDNEEFDPIRAQQIHNADLAAVSHPEPKGKTIRVDVAAERDRAQREVAEGKIVVDLRPESNR